MTASIRAEQQLHRGLDRAAYEHFLPIVRRAAARLARHVPRHITVDDLVGYGWVGLMEAYRRADATMPAREFDAYASYRLRGAMLDYLRSLDPATRGLRRESRRLAETIRNVTRQLRRVPEEEEIAAALAVDLDAYHALLQKIATGGLARLEVLDVDELEGVVESGCVDDAIGKKQLLEAVVEAMGSLPERLQQVMALYYQEECTLQEIGAILGVTESRVSQLHSEAMHRLRATIGRQ